MGCQAVVSRRCLLNSRCHLSCRCHLARFLARHLSCRCHLALFLPYFVALLPLGIVQLYINRGTSKEFSLQAAATMNLFAYGPRIFTASSSHNESVRTQAKNFHCKQQPKDLQEGLTLYLFEGLTLVLAYCKKTYIYIILICKKYIYIYR